jgi:DNA-binding NtrC family response regulator
MLDAFELLEQIAPTDAPVLILGETGTGKELAAEAVHKKSNRTGPFTVCDLGGLSRTVIESELFGHVKGAFTGADQARQGAFECAHNGTLFLDEIGELELSLQPRLLRALEQRAIKPVGSSTYRNVDVRIVAATSRDLRADVKAGKFRADLYHRLAILTVKLPALRDRPEDVPMLLKHFGWAGDCSSEHILAHDWPGNVRELKNAAERARITGVLTTDERESVHGLPTSWRESKQKWEYDYVRHLLERAGGNVSKAARMGNIDRVYLHRLINKLGLN